MKQAQFRKVLLVLVVLILAVGLVAYSPALAARGGGTGSVEMEGYGNGNGQGNAYGYGRGSGTGCDDRAEAARGSEPSISSVEGRDVEDTLTPTSIAAKADSAATGGRPLHAILSGAEEIPGPGDVDGAGSAFLTFNQGQGMICWDLSVTDIVTATAAHIHEGEMGVAGPVVVTLSPPVDGSSFGCTEVDAELIKEIRQNPTGFYVNVHNAEFPAGAIRGQLGK